MLSSVNEEIAPIQEEKELKTEYISPLASNTNKMDRSNVFDPTQAWKWSKKSIAVEFESMLKLLQEQAIDHETAGGSDIEYMSDSDLGSGAMNNSLPMLDSYNAMLTNMTYVQSISELPVKHRSNKNFKEKLDNLHDKISIFIKKVGLSLTKERSHKLKVAYQGAYDFLEDIQHEIEGLDENLIENEQTLNDMENKIKLSESKYKSLMIKFKNARLKQSEDKNTAGALKKQIHELSIEYSQLMLKTINKSRNRKTDSIDWEKKEDLYIPKQLKLPTVTQTVLMRKVAAKKIPPKPKLRYARKNDINPKIHPEIYDAFKVDKGDQCVSQFWLAFGSEIGFFGCNRHG